MTRSARQRVLGMLVGVLALVPAVPASAASLNGLHVTLQFQGTMATVWSFPGTQIGDDGCYVSTESGSGSQTMDFNTHRQHVNMNVVDAGGSIAFQLPPGERAGPNHFALGFRGADVSRIGNEKTVFDKSQFWTPGCIPQPMEHFADTVGCGEKHVPWDMTPIDIGNKFYPEVAAFLPTHMLTQCPTFGPSNARGTESFPPATQTHVPLSEVRHVLGRKHGKLIIHGQHRWHTEDRQGEFEVTATTTVHWKVILIRAHPS